MYVKAKLIHFPAKMWEEVLAYKEAASLPHDMAAVISLVGLGLIRNRETVQAMQSPQKGKKR